MLLNGRLICPNGKTETKQKCAEQQKKMNFVLFCLHQHNNLVWQEITRSNNLDIFRIAASLCCLLVGYSFVKCGNTEQNVCFSVDKIKLQILLVVFYLIFAK